MNSTRVSSSPAARVGRPRPVAHLARLAGAALLSLAAGAHAVPTYNSTAASVAYTDGNSTGLVSGIVSAEHNRPYTGQRTAGYAGQTGTVPATGLPVLTTGAYARSDAGGGTWVNVDAAFQTAFLVGAGTSGLANGAAVRLQVSLQLDGSTSVTSGDDAGYAGMDYSFDITAPDRAVFSPGDGWFVPTIASFGARVRHDIDNYVTFFLSPPGPYHSTSYTSSWGWSSNVGSADGPQVDNGVTVPGNFSSSSSRSFDTGLVLFDFDTFVGDVINISSYLDVWGDSYGSGSRATADFLNTLQASFDSPFAPGIVLLAPGDAGGVPAPTPATAWLLLGALPVLARRRTTNARAGRPVAGGRRGVRPVTGMTIGGSSG